VPRDIRRGEASIDKFRQHIDPKVDLLSLAYQLAFLLCYKVTPLAGGG
jgi:hypothetical protein